MYGLENVSLWCTRPFIPFNWILYISRNEAQAMSHTIADTCLPPAASPALQFAQSGCIEDFPLDAVPSRTQSLPHLPNLRLTTRFLLLYLFLAPIMLWHVTEWYTMGVAPLLAFLVIGKCGSMDRGCDVYIHSMFDIIVLSKSVIPLDVLHIL